MTSFEHPFARFDPATRTAPAALAGRGGWRGWLNRPRRVLFVLSAIWVITLFDLLLTLGEVHAGDFDEANPVAARVIALSPVAVVVYKITLMAGSSAVFLYYCRRRLVEVACWLLLAAHVYVVVCWGAYYDNRAEAHCDPAVNAGWCRPAVRSDTAFDRQAANRWDQRASATTSVDVPLLD